MLEIKSLTVQYRDHTICESVNALITSGEVVALVAPNGTGKTSLMRAIADKVPVRGRCIADGFDKDACHVYYRKRVYYMADGGKSLHPELTVGEHLTLVCRIWEAQHSAEFFSQLCGVKGFLNVRASRLSQGMAQLAALAIVCATEACYLLINEPTNGLDQSNLEVFHAVVSWLAGNGIGIVMSSHILDEVDRMCSKVLFLHGKRLISSEIDGSNGRCVELYRTLYGNQIRR